jgi:hypothetical protein
MGGVALATWSHPRATRDIDFLVEFERKDVDQLVSQMGKAACRPKRNPPLSVVGDHGFVQFLYSPPGEFYEVQLDLMLAESELQKTALERRVSRTVPGIESSIDVLSCEDLFLFKLIAGRIIDRADSAMLLRENWETLDESYLVAWLQRLKMTDDFRDVWHEAFPDASYPI